MDVSVQRGSADIVASKRMSRIEPAGIDRYRYWPLLLGDVAGVSIGYVMWMVTFVVEYTPTDEYKLKSWKEYGRKPADYRMDQFCDPPRILRPGRHR